MGYYNETAIFIKEVNAGTLDSYGDPIFTQVKKELFVSVKSVKYSEFYVAQQAGFDPQIVFVLADYLDFDDKYTLVEYNDVTYKIIRTYRTGNTLEVTCSHFD